MSAVFSRLRWSLPWTAAFKSIRLQCPTTTTKSAQLGYWLIGGSALVGGMVVVGGWTRLTESGLSMVDWKLLHFSPPANDSEWSAYFDKYKQFPEYRLRTSDMTLGDFKRIYMWEHLHRVLGRITGFYFLAPTLWLTIQRHQIPTTVTKRLWAINTLILCQGLWGWHMVKSGLKEPPTGTQSVARVSPFRLTGHLGCAFLIYAMALTTGVSILRGNQLMSKIRWLGYQGASRVCRGMVFATAMSGGMVAGLDAGLVYDTFPWMGEVMVPKEIGQLGTWWQDMSENPVTVQFIHR